MKYEGELAKPIVFKEPRPKKTTLLTETPESVAKYETDLKGWEDRRLAYIMKEQFRKLDLLKQSLRDR